MKIYFIYFRNSSLHLTNYYLLDQVSPTITALILPLKYGFTHIYQGFLILKNGKFNRKNPF